ncbi:hypothetical protein [Ulvibacter antarcticus]|nr:hypothetical protein [Ulvibacter antarcticus]
MLKSIAAIFLSLSLSFTIVAPTILLLFDLDSTPVAMVEITEEELQKKPSKEIEQSKILDNLKSEDGYISFGKNSALFGNSQFFITSFSMEVHIPPPEAIA